MKASLLAKDSKLKDAEAALMPGGQANAWFKEVVLMRAQLAAEDLKPGRVRPSLAASSKCNHVPICLHKAV